MTYTVKDHGVWSMSVPAELPEWAASIPGFKVAFARREGDGADWYEYRAEEGQFAPDSVIATTIKDGEGREIVGGIYRNVMDSAIPFGMRIIEIDGVDPEDPKPWKLFEQKVYDPEAKTFSDQPPPEIRAVSSAQAKTALFNATLDEKVEEIVATHPYKPVRIFYSSANNWLKVNPYVRAIAVELGLLTYDDAGNEVDSGFDKLFEDASKL